MHWQSWVPFGGSLGEKSRFLLGVGLWSLFTCWLSAEGRFQLLEAICIPWLVVPFLHLQSHQEQIKSFSGPLSLTYFSASSSIFKDWGLYWVTQTIQNSLCDLKVLNDNHLYWVPFACQGTYSQVLRIWVWTFLEVHYSFYHRLERSKTVWGWGWGVQSYQRLNAWRVYAPRVIRKEKSQR